MILVSGLSDSVSLCRGEAVQLFLQSSDVCDSVQQSHTNQSAGDPGACQVYSGHFHQLGQFHMAASEVTT